MKQVIGYVRVDRSTRDPLCYAEHDPGGSLSASYLKVVQYGQPPRPDMHTVIQPVRLTEAYGGDWALQVGSEDGERALFELRSLRDAAGTVNHLRPEQIEEIADELDLYSKIREFAARVIAAGKTAEEAIKDAQAGAGAGSDNGLRSDGDSGGAPSGEVSGSPG